MNSINRSVCLALAVLVLAALASSQITFSRDWTGGKRSAPALNCNQFARLCRRFIQDLKSAMDMDISQQAPGHPAAGQVAASKDSQAPNIYDDDGE